MGNEKTTVKNMLEPKNWLKKYGDYLYNFAKIRVRNDEIAEDLVQDSFLSALKAQASYKGEAHEKTWLTAILKNKIIDHYRKNSLAIANDTYLHKTEDSFEGSFFINQGEAKGWMKPEAYIKDWAPQPDQMLENKDLQNSITLCLEKLPSKLAPVFISKYVDHTEPEDICKAFGISSSNYWVILHRAKILLRACLEQQFVFAPAKR
jgi:RNA polymerase sigma-70 factor (TIGR02943 family)